MTNTHNKGSDAMSTGTSNGFDLAKAKRDGWRALWAGGPVIVHYGPHPKTGEYIVEDENDPGSGYLIAPPEALTNLPSPSPERVGRVAVFATDDQRSKLSRGQGVRLTAYPEGHSRFNQSSGCANASRIELTLTPDGEGGEDAFMQGVFEALGWPPRSDPDEARREIMRLVETEEQIRNNAEAYTDEATVDAVDRIMAHRDRLYVERQHQSPDGEGGDEGGEDPNCKWCDELERANAELHEQIHWFVNEVYNAACRCSGDGDRHRTQPEGKRPDGPDWIDALNDGISRLKAEIGRLRQGTDGKYGGLEHDDAEVRYTAFLDTLCVKLNLPYSRDHGPIYDTIEELLRERHKIRHGLGAAEGEVVEAVERLQTERDNHEADAEDYKAFSESFRQERDQLRAELDRLRQREPLREVLEQVDKWFSRMFWTPTADGEDWRYGDPGDDDVDEGTRRIWKLVQKARHSLYPAAPERGQPDKALGEIAQQLGGSEIHINRRTEDGAVCDRCEKPTTPDGLGPCDACGDHICSACESADNGDRICLDCYRRITGEPTPDRSGDRYGEGWRDGVEAALSKAGEWDRKVGGSPHPITGALHDLLRNSSTPSGCGECERWKDAFRGIEKELIQWIDKYHDLEADRDAARREAEQTKKQALSEGLEEVEVCLGCGKENCTSDCPAGAGKKLVNRRAEQAEKEAERLSNDNAQLRERAAKIYRTVYHTGWSDIARARQCGQIAEKMLNPTPTSPGPGQGISKTRDDGSPPRHGKVEPGPGVSEEERK